MPDGLLLWRTGYIRLHRRSVPELAVLVHPEQAEAIVSTLEAVSKAAMVPVENLLTAEQQMVEAARHLSPWHLKKHG